MLLDRGPSWRQGSRPQPVNQAQDLSEQRFGDSDFCELECDVAAMSHDLGADLDELLPERRQRPVFDLIGQGQRPQEVGHVVSQHVWLETNLVVPEAVAGQPRPVDGVLALLDVLLRRAPVFRSTLPERLRAAPLRPLRALIQKPSDRRQHTDVLRAPAYTLSL